MTHQTDAAVTSDEQSLRRWRLTCKVCRVFVCYVGPAVAIAGWLWGEFNVPHQPDAKIEEVIEGMMSADRWLFRGIFLSAVGAVPWLVAGVKLSALEKRQRASRGA